MMQIIDLIIKMVIVLNLNIRVILLLFKSDLPETIKKKFNLN